MSDDGGGSQDRGEGTAAPPADPADLAESLLSDVAKSREWRPLVVPPGDNVTRVIREFLGDSRVVRLGAGLRQQQQQAQTQHGAQTQQQSPQAGVIAVKPGVLHYLTPGRFWVTTNGRRYSPTAGDYVLGTVAERLGMHGYRVNIRGASLAMLPALSFDGASKRNHPDLPVGSLVYARVAAANKHTETELTCCDESAAKKDWMTGEAQYGKLVGGTTFACSHELARGLIHDDSAVLAALAKFVRFEIAVGFNGWIWIDAETPLHAVVVCNDILNSEFLDTEKVEEMCTSLVREFLR